MRARVAVLLVVGCSAPPGGWRVAGGFLRAPDGRAAILRGANVSDAQKRSPYLDVHGPDDYRALADTWGMNAVRFVMTWAAVEPEAGRYDDAYLDRVAERLRWADAAGLVVILDMHQDVYGEGFGFDGAPRWTCDEARYAAFQPREPWFLSTLDENVIDCVDRFWASDDLQRRFAAAWRHTAERLAGARAVIGFDVFNEPEWGSYPIFDFEAERLAPLYRRVVAAVRGVAPGWLAFLEPSASRNAGVATGLPALGAELHGVVYAPHSYDAAAEGGGGFDPARRQAIFDNVAQLADEARALGAALWLGEYGGASTRPGFAAYMRAQYDAAGAIGASTMFWEYGRNEGYGMLAPDGSAKPALLDALVRPYPARVAGDPISYALDEAGKFTLQYRPRGSGATEIVLPAHWSAPTVECGGCRYDIAPGRLRILSPPPADPATITISSLG